MLECLFPSVQAQACVWSMPDVPRHTLTSPNLVFCTIFFNLYFFKKLLIFEGVVQL